MSGSLLNTAREIDQEACRISNKFFKGEVVDVDDPLKKGRVRIKTAASKEVGSGIIPWSMNAIDKGYGPKQSSLDVPPIGSKVWVLYCSEDLQSSLYFGGSKDNSIEIDSELLEDYPNTYGFVDSANNLFCVNPIKGYVKIMLGTGAQICFDSNGLYVDTTNTGPGINEKGLRMNIQGPVSINATEDMSLSCVNFDLNASGNINLNGKLIGLNNQSPEVIIPAAPEKRG